MHRSDIERLADALKTRTPVAQLTWIRSGQQKLIPKAGIDQSSLPSDLIKVIAEGFERDKSGLFSSGGEDVFIRIYNPALRMIMIGAVHIAQALVPLARQTGYDVTIIDPRTAFASEQRFAGVNLDARWPDEALTLDKLDARTAFVALTHDPKIDDPALKIALAADLFYVGALGSRRTHAARIERLASAGISPEKLARINAPIGLDIGAVGADEIAVSIMAEVTAALRGKLNGTVQ